MILSHDLDLVIPSGNHEVVLRFEAGLPDDGVLPLGDMLSLPFCPANAKKPACICLARQPEEEPGIFSLCHGSYLQYRFYHFPDGSIGMLRVREQSQVLTWRHQLSFAVLLAILHGAPVCLLHGVVLVHKNGEATVLFGESGVGKSTTARRYAEAGGKVACDDQMLLRFSPDGSFFVQPLPTWSAAQAADFGQWKKYDCGREYPVRQVYWIARAQEHNEIVKAPPEDYMTRLLRAFTIHTYGKIKIFPSKERVFFGNYFLNLASMIAHKWDFLNLKVHLNTDLLESIPLE